METIGNRLFELRKSRNITQEQLAEELNVSRQSVSNWELDKSLPDTDRLLALALLYEVTLDYIAYGDGSFASDEASHGDGSFATDEASLGDTSSATEEADKLSEGTLEGIMNLLTDSEIAEKKNRAIGRFLWISVLTCTLLLVPVLFFYIQIMSHLANPNKVVASDIVSVDQIHEQYTHADVTKIDDNGVFHRDRVWLDTRNLTEDAYIFAQTEEGKNGKMKFEYYSKTMMIPFVGVLLLFLTDLFLLVALYQIYSQKARK